MALNPSNRSNLEQLALKGLSIAIIKESMSQYAANVSMCYSLLGQKIVIV